MSVGAAAGFTWPSAAGDLQLVFVDTDGMEHRSPLSQCWGTPFERVRPVRKFTSFRGQGNFPGWWWFSGTGDHVGFESWLERDVLMMLDADPEVAVVASQPFWLSWPDGGRTVRHAPDFFARRCDGGGVVIDVRADDRIEPDDAVKFDVTAKACAEVGWEYRRIGELEPVLAANLRWLAGYRHPRNAAGSRVAAVLGAFSDPIALMEGAALAGDPIAVLPVVFHLLWRGILRTDLSCLLRPGTLVCRAGARS